MRQVAKRTEEPGAESRLKDDLSRQMHPLIQKMVKPFLGLEQFAALVSKIQCMPDDPCFLDNVLAALDIEYRISDADRSRIPSEGPVIVVANHPFGAVEGSF